MDYLKRVLSRLFLPGVLIFAIAGGIILSGSNPGEPPTAGAQQQTAYSVQMHAHGSFSEMHGSMEAEARLSDTVGTRGLDVIWWSDHDGFFTEFHMITFFDFEAESLPMDSGETWEAIYSSETQFQKSVEFWDRTGNWNQALAGISGIRSTQEGVSSLRMSGQSPDNSFQQFYWRFYSDIARRKHSLAATDSLAISIYPETVHDGLARPVLNVQLSLHTGDEFFEGYRQIELHYYLDNSDTAATLHENVYSIPLRYTAGEWNAYKLRVTEDANTGFPWLLGEDNSLYQIHFGIESKENTPAEAFFDSLKIHTAAGGHSLYNRQAALIDSLQSGILSDLSITQLQGIEHSQEAHLNEFGGGEIALPDYLQLAIAGGFSSGEGDWITDRKAFRSFAARRVVTVAHRKGHLISYNHPFGALWEGGDCEVDTSILNGLLADSLYGADILEVGYQQRGGKNLCAYLALWDSLMSHRLYPIGTGVSDTHGTHPHTWADTLNNMVSWIYADGTEKAQLVEGLRAGRVFFGDLIRFEGTVDLTTPSGFNMGQIVFTDLDTAEITVSISSGLEAGDSIKVVWGGRLDTVFIAQDASFSETLSHVADSARSTYARVEVYEGDDPDNMDAMAFSNPVYFIKEEPVFPVDAARAAIHLGGVFSRQIRSVTIKHAYYENLGDSTLLSIVARGNLSGTIKLDYSQAAAPASVEFGPAFGAATWSFQNNRLLLGNLSAAEFDTIRIWGASEVLDAASEQPAVSQESPTIEGENIPDEMALSQNFPNPANPATSIKYALNKDSWVTLTIYNLVGEKVATLVNEFQTAGYRSVVWEGTDRFGRAVASGVYIYRMQAEGFAKSYKILLIR